MSYTDELYHHGIRGMRWGIRRYQNADGSLTAAGRKRYLNSDGTLTGKGYEEARRLQKEYAKSRIAYNALTGKRATTAQSKPKPVQEEQKSKEPLRANDPRMMTKQQLDDAVAYQRSLNTYNEMFNPKKQSLGQRFINSALNDVIAPSITKSAQAAMEAKLKQKLGQMLDVKIESNQKKKKQ